MKKLLLYVCVLLGLLFSAQGVVYSGGLNVLDSVRPNTETLKGIGVKDFIVEGVIDGQNFSYQILEPNDTNSFIWMKFDFSHEFEGKIIVEDQYNSSRQSKKLEFFVQGKQFEKIIAKNNYRENKITLISQSGDSVVLHDYDQKLNRTKNYQTVIYSSQEKVFEFLDATSYLLGEYNDSKLFAFPQLKKVFVGGLEGQDITQLKKFLRSGGNIYLNPLLIELFQDEFLAQEIQTLNYDGYRHTPQRQYYNYGFGKIYLLQDYDYNSGFDSDNYNNAYYYNFPIPVLLDKIRDKFFIDNTYILIFIFLFVLGVVGGILYSGKKKYYFGSIYVIVGLVVVSIGLLSIAHIFIKGYNDTEFRIKINQFINGKQVYSLHVGNLFTPYGGKYEFGIKKQDYFPSVRLEYPRRSSQLGFYNEKITYTLDNVYAGGVLKYAYTSYEDSIARDKTEYDIVLHNFRELENYLGSNIYHYHESDYEINFIGVKENVQGEYKYGFSDIVEDQIEVDIYYNKKQGLELKNLQNTFEMKKY